MGTTTSGHAPGGKGLGDLWGVVIVVSLGSFMSVLDTTIVNVALDSLSRGLHTSIDHVQWVVTAYLLSLGAVIPVSGWAARRFGARRVFLISVVLFTLGSAACGLAGSIDELIGSRVLQGIGGGMLVPVGQMILVREAGAARLARAMTATAIPMNLSPTLGPTIGGLLLSVSWHWIFYVNVPVGVAAVICALKVLKPDAPEKVPRPDLTGFLLVAGGMAGVTYGLAQTGPHPFGSTLVLAPLLGGVTLLALFALRALRVRHPLLDVRLYANPGYRDGALAYFCMAAVLYGGMILLPLYFQVVRGDSPIVTGLLLIPQGLGSTVGNLMAGRLMDRIGAGVATAAGAAFAIVGTIPLIFLGARTSLVLVGGCMVLRGVGIGATLMPASAAAIRAVGPAAINDAAPQLNVIQRLGGSIGTAVMAVALQHGLTAAGRSPAGEAAAFDHTFILVAIVTAAAIPPVLFLIRAERRTARGVAVEAFRGP